MERNKDFYANEWNGFKGLFRSINQYFKSESNKIFIEPLEFMHLLDEKLQYIKNNLDKPFSTVNHLNNSFNSEIEKHIIYRFILKAYNATYPFSLHDSIQISPLLKLIEIEFLSFKEDTPEKLDYLDGSASYLTESKASSYKFNKNDFKNISTNYDFDFFYKCEQLKEGVEWLPFKINSINVVFKTIEHFERGKRKGLIEPLAFLNLNFKYYSLLIENPESRYATIDLIRELRIDDEVKHILWGFILLWIREYYKINSVIEYQSDKDILNEIEEEFLSYDGYTPEKQLLKYPTKEILDKYYPKLSEKIKIFTKWFEDEKKFIEDIKPYITITLTKQLLHKQDEFLKSLDNADIDRIVEFFNTNFSNIPYDHFIEAKEGYYNAMINVILQNNIEIKDFIDQRHVNVGRSDIIIFRPTKIYCLELKINKTADEALMQIFHKQYLHPYKLENKELIAVGINISTSKKQITEFKYKQYQ